jgi:hypothetical protein
VTLTEKGYSAFSYWAKNLSAEIDLLANNWGMGDELVIRVHPVPGGAVGSVDAPMVITRTDWAPKLILWPSLLGGVCCPPTEQSTFAAIPERGEPQALVQLT